MNNVVFANSAVDHMKEVTARGNELSDVADLIATLQDISTVGLRKDRNAMRVARVDGMDVFEVRTGGLRAILTEDPGSPDRLVVVSVYRAGEEGRSDLGKILAEAKHSARLFPEK